MGLLDKIKNVFFEEEYVEVEEPVKKEKTPVAKKIETSEVKHNKEESTRKERPKEFEKERVIKEEKKEEKEEPKEDSITENSSNRKTEKAKEKDFRFDFNDRDFEMEEKPTIEEKEKPPVVLTRTVYEEKREYHKKEKEPEYYAPINNSYQGLYEGNNDSKKDSKKQGFTLSPIISPVYGILDKNYKKEEIVAKKEIRISASSRKVDLDYVREKAYGDLASDIVSSIHENPQEKEEKDTVVEEDNLLYDLNEEEKPAVKVVTVGDAEEYFNDLGLEYNVDYKVAKEEPKEKEESPARRSDRTKELEDKIEEQEKDSLEETDTNLFDLIDSMYDDKE